MIAWAKGLFLRLLDWLAPSQIEDVDSTCSTPEIHAQQMELAERQIRDAKRRIRVIQAGLDVVTRGQR